MNTTRMSIRPADARLNSLCPLLEIPLPADHGPIAVFCGRAMLHPDAARIHAPVLAEIAALGKGTVGVAEPGFRIEERTALPDGFQNRRCPINGDALADPAVRPFEIVGGDYRFLGVEGGESAAPCLAAALHLHYGTSPAPRQERPVKVVEKVVPPTVETQEQEQDRTAREKAGRRARALALVTEVVGVDKAEKVVRAVELLTRAA
jgi:hypothetical protein